MNKKNIEDVKSFISEHTAEYAIVPILKDILQEKFANVVPIFPWAKREGGNLSRIIHQSDKFYIMGLYSRRPKLCLSNDNKIYIKLNKQIMTAANTGFNLGIPFIAGCPIVRTFWELGKNPQCIWIRLDKQFNDDITIEYDLTLNNKNQIFLTKEMLNEYILKNMLLMDIKFAMESFRIIKQNYTENPHTIRFLFVNVYKPIYFLLRN